MTHGRSNPSQRGFSLLEQAMVLPILLVIVAGAFDINTLLQGYSALQQGVNASLRCVYTSDGACVSGSPDSRPRLYNYYRVERHQEYLVDLYDFRGLTSWINRPVYRFDDFSATVLGAVHYDQPTANISVRQKYFPAERTASFTLRKATRPYILNSAKSPALRYRGAPANETPRPQGSYPAHTYPITGVDLTSDLAAGDPAVVERYFEFTTKAQPSRPIVYSNTPQGDETAAHQPDFAAGIQSSADVPVAIHITGNKQSTSIGSQGGVSIELQRRSASGQWLVVGSLGGQQLGRSPGEDARANFVIRGLPESHIDPSVPEYEELRLYSPMRLSYGTRYRISFTLSRQAGRVGWQAEELRLYYPVDEDKDQPVPCAGGLSPCTPASACVTGNAIPAEVLTADVKVHLDRDPLRFGELTAVGACEAGHGGLESILASRRMIACAEAFDVQIDAAFCAPVQESRSCPAIGMRGEGAMNFGVPETAGEDNFIRSSALAANICPAPTDALAGPARSPRWSLISAPVPSEHVAAGSSGSFTWIQESCTAGSAWPAGSMLSHYHHLSYTRRIERYDPFYTGQRNPADVMADPASGFHCRDFSLGSQVVDVTRDNRTERNQGSLFFGEHHRPGCHWAEALRQDGIDHGLVPDDAYFAAYEPVAAGRKARVPEQPDACIDPHPELVWSEPDRQELIAGGPYPHQSPPNECREAGVACAAEFAGFGAGDRGGTHYDFSHAAQHFGFGEIQAHYPAARWNCADKHCARIEVQEDGAFMRASGSINVPLYILGSRSVELRYSGRERKEAEFSR